MTRMLVLAALATLSSGCWNGVQVIEDGLAVQTIRAGDMPCVACEYNITPSNAVIHVVFRKDACEKK